MLNHQTTYLRKSTSATVMLFSRPTEPILFLVKRFIQNVEWTYDLLSLIEKLIHGHDDITKFERLIVEDYLQFQLVKQYTGYALKDRQGNTLETTELLFLRQEIERMAEHHALGLVHNPHLHPLKKAFKQVLTKIGYENLSEEAHAILREAYLFENKGLLYTLKGRMVQLPHFTKRMLWKLIG